MQAMQSLYNLFLDVVDIKSFWYNSRNMYKQITPFFLVAVFLLLSFVNVQEVYAVVPSIQSSQVLAYTNAERFKVGRSLLTTNDLLSKVAYQKMQDLFARQYFAHESPTGESVSDLAKKNGYKYIVVGENLAMGGFTSSKEVVDAWMNSPGHKKNILSETYSEIGIASGRGMIEGQETWMVVQSFGYPSSKCPSVSPTFEAELKKMDQKLLLLGSLADIRKNVLTKSKGSLEERQTLINSYNIVARVYNKTVKEYEELVEEYNAQVGKYNSCVKKVSKKLK
jgi:hypothetical protein